MNEEQLTKATADLVRAAATTLREFRSGRAPTFNMLDRLEACLFPFTHDKMCGHRITEECDCSEMARL